MVDKQHLLTSMSGCTHFLEVDKTSLNIDRYQLQAHLIAHIHAIEPLYHLALNRNVKQPGPGAFIRCTCNDSLKLLTDLRFKQQCRCRFAYLPFDFVNGILLRG
jgi:hypothetical protein